MTANVYGRLDYTPDRRDHVARAAAPYTGQFVDLTAGFPDPPYDQLALGSCVPNGTAAAADYARARQGLPPLRPPSRLFVYWFGRQVGGYPAAADSGLQIRDGFQALHTYGAPAETDWPYDIARFADRPPAKAITDGKADESVAYGAVTDIDAMIASGYPVVFGWHVYESFEAPGGTDTTGVMPVPDRATEQTVGGHCTVLCSTPLDGSDRRVGGVRGVKYRLARNSWGHDGTWGCPDRPGYYWHPLPAMTEASDFWQVTTMSDANRPVPPGPGPAPVPPGPPPFPVRWLRSAIAWLGRLIGLG
jgi:hypothetical protein